MRNDDRNCMVVSKDFTLSCRWKRVDWPHDDHMVVAPIVKNKTAADAFNIICKKYYDMLHYYSSMKCAYWNDGFSFYVHVQQYEQKWINCEPTKSNVF